VLKVELQLSKFPFINPATPPEYESMKLFWKTKFVSEEMESTLERVETETFPKAPPEKLWITDEEKIGRRSKWRTQQANIKSR
jgi:hypothetical protein